ncbi:MAG: hypothetical protein H0X62_14340 [Bacteroidetes bacterium]|nr:hypothetical protein [Bacteroidota bacterium]
MEKINNLDKLIKTEQILFSKLLKLKQGLMNDLLSGKKRVKVEEKESEIVSNI